LPPTYLFSDFQAACGQGDTVTVSNDAQDDARDYFHLRNELAIRDFIFNNGLENLEFIDTKPWRNNPDPNVTIMIDAYSFRSGLRYGYIAFFNNKKIGKWRIKSFKKNWDAPTTKQFIIRGSGFPRRIIDITTGEENE